MKLDEKKMYWFLVFLFAVSGIGSATRGDFKASTVFFAIVNLIILFGYLQRIKESKTIEMAEKETQETK